MSQHQQPPPPQQPPRQPPHYPQTGQTGQPPPPQQQQHGGQTYDQSGQPTSPAHGGQPNPNQQHPQQQQEERERQERERREREQRPNQPPGESHPAHRDTPPERQQAGQDRPPPPPSKEEQDKARAEQRELSQAASIGAQVILDYNGDAGVAARGGAAPTIEENSAIRDACLLDMGLDPVACSGPPSEERAKKLKEPPKTDPPLKIPPQATKASSLAADLGGGAPAPRP